MTTRMTTKKILLLDGFSILNRAFYALPLLTTQDGEYTNAVYGFMNMLFRFIDEENPDYITVAFDLPKPTFRHNAYGAYKGTRKSMPEELRVQVPTLKNLLQKMEINIAEQEGYEADDVIGTLATLATAQGIQSVIITGDRDLLQLATDTVTIRLPKTSKGKTTVEDYGPTQVEEKYGVSPQAFIDVKALMGDTSDNVPGVPGIGEVTATKIIAAYGSLEAAIENVADLKPKKAAENLATFKDQALLSRMLVTIVTDAPVELNLHADTQLNMFNPTAIEEIKRLELKTLYKRFETKAEAEAKTETPQAIDYTILTTAAAMETAIANLPDTPIGISIHWHEQTLVGIALDTYYFTTAMGEISLLSQPGILELDAAQLLKVLTPWLQSNTPKAIFDYKTHARKLATTYNISIAGPIFDTMLAAYVLDPMAPTATLHDITPRYLSRHLPNIEDQLDNKGKRAKDRKTLHDLDASTLAAHATAEATANTQLHSVLHNQLTATDQLDLFYSIEIPTAQVLLEMELAGIQIDTSVLTSYGNQLDQRISELTAEIHGHALAVTDEPFNINSPAQVGVILFEKLGLRGGKKTKQGYSTAADVLEKIKNHHPIVPLILEYRAHAKLKSTYVDGMLPLVDPASSRIHSTFKQALTATGRLSSAEPNLQNIPIRMPLGRELRKAFVARPGHVFIDADYSQIELRLLAHMSGDDTLIDAFHHAQDIHRLTASEVLGIDPSRVTDSERSRAKAVNFGIVYGMGAFGLSEDLKISVKEAEEYIQGYFRRYPGVKRYLDTTITHAKENGYVATIYNRRRKMDEFKSQNYNMRQFGERVAMNMPIQGSAADIIKIAMINVARALKEKNLQSKILLQVHDELVLEVPTEEKDTVAKLLQSQMESAVSLDVPLVADINIGTSWFDTK